MQRSILDLFRHQPEPRDLAACLKAWQEAGVLGGNLIAIKKALTRAVESENLLLGSIDAAGLWQTSTGSAHLPGLLVCRGPSYPNEEETVIGKHTASYQICSAPKERAGASPALAEARN